MVQDVAGAISLGQEVMGQKVLGQEVETSTYRLVEISTKLVEISTS